MRKGILLLMLAVVVCGVLSVPAAAGKKKRSKPVATTMYAHGQSQLGEIDGAQWVADVFPPTSPLTLDAEEPSGTSPKSQSFATVVLNTQCTGAPIANPVFQGNLSGTIVGDLKAIAHFISAPGTITARLWVDVPIFQCNDAYVEPAAEVDVKLPTGQGEVEIVFPDLKISATSQITIQIFAPDFAQGYQGQMGRLLYDSADAPTRLEFKCIPTGAKRSCL